MERGHCTGVLGKRGGKSSTGLPELQLVLPLQEAEGASVQPARCSQKGGLDPLGLSSLEISPCATKHDLRARH